MKIQIDLDDHKTEEQLDEFAVLRVLELMKLKSAFNYDSLINWSAKVGHLAFHPKAYCGVEHDDKKVDFPIGYYIEEMLFYMEPENDKDFANLNEWEKFFMDMTTKVADKKRELGYE